MTKKDHQMVARAFNRVKKGMRVKKENLTLENLFRALVQELELDFSLENPCFDRINFVEMCNQ